MSEYDPNFHKVNWFVMKKITETSSTIHSHYPSEKEAQKVADSLGPEWYIEQEVFAARTEYDDEDGQLIW